MADVDAEKCVLAAQLLSFAAANPGVQVRFGDGRGGVIVEVADQWLATCQMHTVWVTVADACEPVLLPAADTVQLRHDRTIRDPYLQVAPGEDAGLVDLTDDPRQRA
jgi:hypothetical protein